MLLRNEGLLLFVIFTLWFLLTIRKPGIMALFVVLPGAVMTWYLIEPTLRGDSFFDYFTYVTRSKEIENLVGNISRRDALMQWILMLSAVPTLIVVAPGLYELWKNRRRAQTDIGLDVRRAGWLLFFLNSYLSLASAVTLPDAPIRKSSSLCCFGLVEDHATLLYSLRAGGAVGINDWHAECVLVDWQK